MGFPQQWQQEGHFVKGRVSIIDWLPLANSNQWYFNKLVQMHDLIIGLFVNRYEFGLAV
jgi:hypothetical protein